MAPATEATTPSPAAAPCTWCGHVPCDPECLTKLSAAREQQRAPIEALDRAGLEFELRQARLFERRVQWIALVPAMDLRWKLEQLDVETRRIPRELELTDVVRALLVYARSGKW